MKNNLMVEPRPVPLTQLENGVWRITGTRIPLERVVECYQAGYTPEEIVEAFDVLKLSDVYHVLGYYLDHKEEVEAYIREQNREAEDLRRMIEENQRPTPTRAELLARKARMERENGQAGK
jgi:uncharacterized protein (DUF433 family)